MKILFICHGNICRSPMAEFVLKDMAKKRRIDGLEIASAATSYEEQGNPVHCGTKAKLREEGIPVEERCATRMTKGDYEKYDLLIAMESYNIRNIMRIIGEDPQDKVHLLLDYTDRRGDIADPWYTGNFDETYDDVVRGCEGLLKYLGY